MTRSKDYNKNRFAFVIPVYNHAGTVAQVAKDAQKLGYPVVVVDDGSTDDTYNQIKEIKDIQLLQHEQNQGKGAAILTGFTAAAKMADWAIIVDADGQHYPEDAKKLIKAIPKNTRPTLSEPEKAWPANMCPGQAVLEKSFPISGCGPPVDRPFPIPRADFAFILCPKRSI